MKFNFRRAKTPAYLTSLALIVIGLLLAVASVSVLAWIVMILGIALNVMAVSITQINEGPSRARGTGTSVVPEPEADTEQHDAVPAARPSSSSLRGSESPKGSESLRGAEDRVGTARDSSAR